ncbi:DUF3467 domain-containing protein [Nocardia sp. NBC_00565]|uniref:DUF3467 domain-containing protein n=1 Tax=Nocardia sp. NBC_00565 TaxID=2975993 RepID=UPI002E807E2E|nr:DUF3467 domain-containing protein [Nocardia sp. NBC_00565]WUC06001.1 DUF3467 domain-containing protein [Nocardia sp. NBC_00565]
MSEPTVPPTDVEVIVPEAMSAGVYANGFTCWYNRTDFTLDLLVYLPTDQGVDDAGRPVVRQPAQVVSRVKFPPAMIFRLMQILNDSMSNYEHQFGPIVHLGE